jgi:3-methyladenine DNA glycosylase AlkD
MPLIQTIKSEILSLSNKSLIPFYTKFFRALPGDICEGDKLLAIKVPLLRKIIVKYWKEMAVEDCKYFMDSEYNEMRFFGQEVLLTKYRKTNNLDDKKKYMDYFIANIRSVNHWNLVDNCSGDIGKWCWNLQDFSQLELFHNSESIWERRIAIVANIVLIKKGEYDLALQYILNGLQDKHEYIQKANGWVLRELGKKNEQLLITFLKQNKSTIPSITKSYATEHLRKTYDIKNLLK